MLSAYRKCPGPVSSRVYSLGLRYPTGSLPSTRLPLCPQRLASFVLTWKAWGLLEWVTEMRNELSASFLV